MKRLIPICLLLAMAMTAVSINCQADNIAPANVFGKAILPGDANCDGVLSVADLTSVAASILAGNAAGGVSDGTVPGDINGDGMLSVADLTAIAAKILAGETTLPEEDVVDGVKILLHNIDAKEAR